MQWFEAVDQYVHQLQPVAETNLLKQRILSLLDLTRLQEKDDEASVAAFLVEASSIAVGHIAAVCVYPPYVRLAAASLTGSPIKVATVVNFPEGEQSLENVLLEINAALMDGAQEIDVVFPYQRYLAGEQKYAQQFVQACKAACGLTTLKVILETGVLADPTIIADAAYDAFVSGADFVKTSTGKVEMGATLEAAAAMLLVIHHLTPQVNRPLGLKVSGGVRSVQQAAQYLQLAEQIMGKAWATPVTFRIGASRLVGLLPHQRD